MRLVTVNSYFTRGPVLFFSTQGQGVLNNFFPSIKLPFTTCLLLLVSWANIHICLMILIIKVGNYAKINSNLKTQQKCCSDVKILPAAILFPTHAIGNNDIHREIVPTLHLLRDHSRLLFRPRPRLHTWP